MILSLVTLSICANASEGYGWTCECNFNNHEQMTECEKCHRPNPWMVTESEDPEVQSPSDGDRRPTMQIFLQNLSSGFVPTGRTYTLDVEPNDTIANVKAKLQNMAGIPPHVVRIRLNVHLSRGNHGLTLSDACILSDYNIQHESTLYMQLNLSRWSSDDEAQSQHEAPREEVSLGWLDKIYNFITGKSGDAEDQSTSEDVEAQSQNSYDAESLDDAEVQHAVHEIELQYHDDAVVQRLIDLTRHEQEQRDAENQRRLQEHQERLQRETEERERQQREAQRKERERQQREQERRAKAESERRAHEQQLIEEAEKKATEAAEKAKEEAIVDKYQPGITEWVIKSGKMGFDPNDNKYILKDGDIRHLLETMHTVFPIPEDKKLKIFDAEKFGKRWPHRWGLKSAHDKAVKKAYHQASRLVHPDKNPKEADLDKCIRATLVFKELADAFERFEATEPKS